MGNPPFEMYMPSHQPRKGVRHSITIMGLWGELTITGRPSDVCLYCNCLWRTISDNGAHNWGQRFSSESEKFQAKDVNHSRSPILGLEKHERWGEPVYRWGAASIMEIFTCWTAAAKGCTESGKKQKKKKKHGWISFFYVDYCLFELQDTRASDRVDLSAVVQRLGIASLEMGCWGQMIWKIPETGPRQVSATMLCGGRCASRGWSWHTGRFCVGEFHLSSYHW